MSDGITDLIRESGERHSYYEKDKMKQPKDERQAILIKMPYIPGLSVNHYKFAGGKYTKPEVKDWMMELQASVCSLNQLRGPFSNIKVSLSGTFKDKRSSPDLHNLLKIVLDSVEKATGINDRDIRTETDIPRVVKRDYGIFFGKVNLQCTGEITIEIREQKD